MFLASRVASQAPEVLVTLLIFSLSSGVFGGVLFYVDSAAPDVLREMSDGAGVHMEVQFDPSFYLRSNYSLGDINRVVSTQEGVLASELIILLQVFDWEVLDYLFRSTTCVGVNADFFTVFHDEVRLSPESSPLYENGCYVEKTRLLAQGLSVGQNYTFSVPRYTPTMHRVNYTLTVLGAFESGLVIPTQDVMGPSFSSPSLITTVDSLNTKATEITHFGDNAMEDRIWVKFDIDQFARQDPNEIRSSLLGVQRRIEETTLPFASVSEFRLLNVIDVYSFWMTSIRVITLAFSVPSIVMGIMLIQYNSSLLTDQMRGEVGAIKTRGASGRQAFAWVMSLSVFTGIVGSLGAVLTGGLAALLSGTAKDITVFDIGLLSGFELVILPGTVAALFLFSFTVGLAVAVPAAVRAFLLLPVEAHDVLERQSFKKGAEEGNPMAQAATAAVSGVLVIPLLGVLGSSTLNSTASMLYALVIILLLATFIVGTGLLLSRPASTAKSHILLRLHGRSLRVGTLLMARSALTSKRSEALGVMFIALVFTSGLFSSVTAATATNHVRELFEFRHGADVVVDLKPTSDNSTLQLVDRISSVAGVAQASGMLRGTAKAGFWKEWSGLKILYYVYVTVYGIQPEKWLESAFVLSYFTYLHPASESVERLQASNTNVLTSFMPVLEYNMDALGRPVPEYSDEMTLEIYGPTGSHTSNCTVVDVLAANLEEGENAQTYFPGEFGARDFVVIDLSYLHFCLNTTRLSRIYVRLEGGADYVRVMQDILALDPASIQSVSSPYEEMEAVLQTRTCQAVTGTYALNLIFSFLYLTAGTCLVVTAKTRTMRRHFSLLRALGMDRRPITVSVLLDSVVNVGLGAVVGCIMGMILTLLMLSVPMSYLGTMTSVSWKDLRMTVTVPVSLLVGVVSIAFLFSLLSTYLIAERSLTSNIADDVRLRE